MAEVPDPAAVRAATPDDAEAISRVHVESWQVAYRGLVPDAYLDALSWPDRVEERRERLRQGGAGGVRTAVVADPDVAGFVAWGPDRDDGEAAGAEEIYALYVDPPRWREGIGRVLLSHAVAASAAAPAVRLWVLEGNARARTFYRRSGFVEDGARKTIELGGRELPELRYRLDDPVR
jgi:ribosomal protein S18 acetylase RimI-like enzyme